jgi:hypothetical protein
MQMGKAIGIQWIEKFGNDAYPIILQFFASCRLFISFKATGRVSGVISPFAVQILCQQHTQLDALGMSKV